MSAICSVSPTFFSMDFRVKGGGGESVPEKSITKRSGYTVLIAKVPCDGSQRAMV